MYYRTFTGFTIMVLFLCTTFLTANASSSVANKLANSMIEGKVLETMDSGGYTYAQVETKEGAVWAAIPKATITKGQDISLKPGALMENFPSKTLNRTFDAIIFSGGINGASAANPHATIQPVAKANGGNSSFADALKAESKGAGPMAGGANLGAAATTSGSSGAVVPSANIKVEKAEGGQTIAELFANPKDFNNKTVKVRGNVVKVSKMIMGKNWLHLQDGTGDASKNTHDLVVTTMSEPTKDSVVIVEGVLHTAKDFGFGYFYDVIVEDATIK